MAVRFSSAGTEEFTAATGLPGSAVYTVTWWTYLAVDRNTFSCQLSLGIEGSYVDVSTASDGTTVGVYDPGAYSGTPLGAVALSVGTWWRLALVVAGTTATFYRAAATDPVLAGATASGNFTAGAPAGLSLGDSVNSGNFPWNGRIASLKMWAAALTQAEVEAELAQYRPARCEGLLRWHPFLAAETVDYSGQGAALSGGTGTTTEDGPPIPWGGASPQLLLPAGAAQQPGAAALSADATLATDATVTRPAAVGLTAAATLSAGATVAMSSAAPFSAAGTLTTAAVTVRPGAAALTATSSLGATTAVGMPAAAALATTTVLTVDGVRVAPGAASLLAATTLTSAGTTTGGSAVALAAAATLQAGAGGIPAAAALTAAATVTMAAIRQALGAVALAVQTHLLVGDLIAARDIVVDVVLAGSRWRAGLASGVWFVELRPSRWSIQEVVDP